MRGRLFIAWTRRLMLIAGTVALSYVALTLIQARSYQNAANNSLEEQIHAAEQHTALPSRSAIKEGDVLGRIEIPRVGVSVAILEGTTPQTLRMGVGHIDGTALPGQPGNSGIAGHRDTYFRELKEIRSNDQILIHTATGVESYEVDWVQITNPSDVDILRANNRLWFNPCNLLSISLYWRSPRTVCCSCAHAKEARYSSWYPKLASLMNRANDVAIP